MKLSRLLFYSLCIIGTISIVFFIFQYMFPVPNNTDAKVVRTSPMIHHPKILTPDEIWRQQHTTKKEGNITAMQDSHVQRVEEYMIPPNTIEDRFVLDANEELERIAEYISASDIPPTNSTTAGQWDESQLPTPFPDEPMMAIVEDSMTEGSTQSNYGNIIVPIEGSDVQDNFLSADDF